MKLLIPSVIRRIYNLGNKQIIKVFARVFNIDHQRMTTDLQSGDVAETVVKYFEKSKTIKPATSSTLTIKQIDKFLEDLSKFTQESQQQKHFEDFCKNCTIQDLKFIIRLIKHDLKMNCLGRHVLDSLHSQAYNSFQSSRDLNKVLIEFGDKIEDITKQTRSPSKSTGLQVLVPISPMLAEACKDLTKAIKKCPGGFYSEIKYDGERVQIHKSQDDFKFYSRSLKDVVDHKVSRLKEFLPKAFPSSDDMILDSEILVVNTITGAILPFGTLGIHKKNNFKDAEVCLFVFDVLYFNGRDLTKDPLKERRKLLEDNITVLKNHIHLSEYKLLKTTNALVDHVEEVLSSGLEGLVLKDVDGIYEPGKRHWLKVKKDYLCDGKIADTADLLILGAWYGTGKRGSLYSVYLMGCYDKRSNLWKTVTKCGNGLDDNTMHKMHTKLEKLVEDSNRKTPSWLKCSSSLIPDVIAKDPHLMPVLEIMANEFSESDVHTAVCSMRFPRIIKIRDDKSYKEATNMEELAHLYRESKAGTKLGALKDLKVKDTNNNADSKPSKASTSGLTLITKFVKKETPETSSKQAVKRKSSCEKKDEKYEKKPKLSEIDEFDVKPPTSNGFFKGVHLFYSGTLLKDLKEDIREFQKLGGELTKNSLTCTHALHSGRIFVGTLDELRLNVQINKCFSIFSIISLFVFTETSTTIIASTWIIGGYDPVSIRKLLLILGCLVSHCNNSERKSSDKYYD